jgi:hypothetical protein
MKRLSRKLGRDGLEEVIKQSLLKTVKYAKLLLGGI